MTALAASPPPVTFPTAAADHALLRRVVEQEHVAQTLPGPDWSGYLVELARAALDALPDAIAPARDALLRLGLSMDSVARVLLATVALAAAVLVAIGLRRFLRRARPVRLPRDAAAAVASVPVRGRDEWRALLDHHLRDGRTADALEAAWWWLAAAVSRGPVDPSWTSRELLARSGRLDLGGPAATLDRLTYGPLRPGAEDVRGVIRLLEAAI